MLQDERDQLLQTLAELKREKEALQSEVDRLRRQHDQNEDEASAMSDKVKRDMAKAEEVIGHLHQTLKEKDEVIANLTVEVERLEGVVTAHQQQQQNVGEHNEEIVKQLRMELAQSQAEVETIKTQVQADIMLAKRQAEENVEAAKKNVEIEIEAAKKQAADQFEADRKQIEAELETTKKQAEAEVERLTNEVTRLRQHLVAVEENYTGELMQAQEQHEAVLAKLTELQLHQQVVSEDQEQLRSLITQRDKARNEVSRLEDRVQQHSTSIANLQAVIEQLEKDHQRKVRAAETEAERRVAAERAHIERLSTQLASVETRLQESLQALEAASRLSETIDQNEVMITHLKKEGRCKLYS